ncbi:MAG TPA: hypothetical protein ENH40_02260 [Nitrospirae bacterium]|nr:hypothetical protein [Nitrospirota bacterium]
MGCDGGEKRLIKKRSEIFTTVVESCIMFFVDKPPASLLIKVIVHESLVGSSKRVYCRALMPLKDSLLPEGIITLPAVETVGIKKYNKNYSFFRT